MSKSVILTGLRANNNLTLGNYFGGMLPIIDMAKQKSEEYQVNMFIPDLHSFTTPIDHSTLYENVLQNARIFAAAGLPLDNDNIFMYRQSYISAHSELAWILECFTGFGEMKRMTQFKDKSRTGDSNSGVAEENSDRVSVGLFNYPILMAADILLYNAKYVPVGEDQTQHLEFTRDIAVRLNNKFGDIFTVPEPISAQLDFFGKTESLRIKDLIDPTKKMSKSDDSGRGVIFLSDEPEVAAKKIMSATTDDLAQVQFDKKNQPGISNLLEILSLVRNEPLEVTASQFTGVTRYGDFKKVVADEVKTFLTEFQLRLREIDDDEIIQKLEQSEQNMTITANATLLRAQKAVGLRSGETK